MLRSRRFRRQYGRRADGRTSQLVNGATSLGCGAEALEPRVLLSLAAAPVSPANLHATLATETALDLSWIDRSTDEDGFEVERSTSGTFQTIDESVDLPAGTTGFHDAGLTMATTYYYRVSAFNSAGASAYATTSVATPSGPLAPASVAAVNDTASDVRLQWVDRSTIETGYRVERSGVSNFYNIDFAVTLPANFTTFDDPSVQPRHTYFYRVTTLGSASNSSPVLVTVTTPDVPPAAPSNLQALPLSSTEIDLTWTDNSTNATGFTVERSSGSGFVGIARTNTTSFADTGVAPLGVYSYRVEAVNTAGQSDASNTATAQAPPSQLVTQVAQLPPVIDPLASSSPSPVVTSNGIGYFVAYDFAHGRELWRTDGTSAGTYLLTEIGPGVTDSYAENLTDVNGTLYFSAQLPRGLARGSTRPTARPQAQS